MAVLLANTRCVHDPYNFTKPENYNKREQKTTLLERGKKNELGIEVSGVGLSNKIAKEVKPDVTYVYKQETHSFCASRAFNGKVSQSQLFFVKIEVALL